MKAYALEDRISFSETELYKSSETASQHRNVRILRIQNVAMQLILYVVGISSGI
jgi:hypothetical protein